MFGYCKIVQNCLGLLAHLQNLFGPTLAEKGACRLLVFAAPDLRGSSAIFATGGAFLHGTMMVFQCILVSVPKQSEQENASKRHIARDSTALDVWMPSNMV